MIIYVYKHFSDTKTNIDTSGCKTFRFLFRNCCNLGIPGARDTINVIQELNVMSQRRLLGKEADLQSDWMVRDEFSHVVLYSCCFGFILS